MQRQKKKEGILNILKTEVVALHINNRIKFKEMDQYREAESKELSPVHLAVNEEDPSGGK